MIKVWFHTYNRPSFHNNPSGFFNGDLSRLLFVEIDVPESFHLTYSRIKQYSDNTYMIHEQVNITCVCPNGESNTQNLATFFETLFYFFLGAFIRQILYKYPPTTYRTKSEKLIYTIFFKRGIITSGSDNFLCDTGRIHTRVCHRLHYTR